MKKALHTFGKTDLVLVLGLGLVFTACSSAMDPPEIPALSGTVSISGTAQVGQTLRANTNALKGEGAIAYQWIRGESTNVGTGGSVYLPLAEDVGSVIKVQVNRMGYEGTVTSEATEVVVAEEAPEGDGAPGITGYNFGLANGTLRLGTYNVESGTMVGTFHGPSGGTAPYTYSLVDGEGSTDNNLFTMSDSILYVGSNPLSVARTYSIRVQICDSKNVKFSDYWAIEVLPVAPEITDITFTPVEGLESYSGNVDANDIVGSFSATGGTAPFSYSLVSGSGSTNNSSLKISGVNLILKTGISQAHAQTISFRVKAWDNAGKTFEKACTFEVAAPPNADGFTFTPSVGLQVGSGNVDASDTVGTFSASTAGPLTPVYALVSGDGSTDNSLFSISGTSLIVGGTELTTAKTYSVRIKLTDSWGRTSEQVCTFEVAAPPDVTGFTFIATVGLQVGSGNVDVSDTVGTFSSPIGGSSPFTYSLAAGNGSTDNGLFAISGTSLKVGDSLLTTAKTYSVRVRIADKYNMTYEKVCTFGVAVATGGGAISILPPTLPGDALIDLVLAEEIVEADNTILWQSGTISAGVNNYENFSAFAWYIDGQLVPYVSDAYVSKPASAYSLGRHNLTVIVTKASDSKDYSKTIQFTVVRED